MRINTIGLTWFRGAADTVTLDANGKSITVYGENASGKSSFVDGVEYMLNGKLGHLAHEYSGKHQEKAIINTHTPKNTSSAIRGVFADGTDLKIDIKRNGAATRSGSGSAVMNGWDYRRTVLRQEEVAQFIRETKGEKYSALLPLLGLQPLELAAENLRRLARTVDEQSGLTANLRPALAAVQTKRNNEFGALNDDEIGHLIALLHAQYCPEKAATTTELLTQCEELKVELGARIGRFAADQRRYVALNDAGQLKLKDSIARVRAASVEMASATEPFIAEKLQILESAGTYAGKLTGDEVQCPACGTSVAVKEFRAHVDAEKNRLQTIRQAFNTRKAEIATLCDILKSLKTLMGREDLKGWRESTAAAGLADNFTYADSLNVEAIRASCNDDQLVTIETNLLALIDAAAEAARQAPPGVQKLIADDRTATTAQEVWKARNSAQEVARIDGLISFLRALEQGIREELRQQSQAVVDEISAEVAKMWKILHPGNGIDGIRLHLPPGADKAIDVCLKFHGVEQDSPRLTLSEGYRNSLGLCIFLAMAKREKDRPLFLDDVVVSLDRDHRGMVAELLEKEFAGRQIFLFTHDRDWYIELRHMLNNANWGFKALVPWESPVVGIRWSDRTWGFDDARAQLNAAPDVAGNTARKIMDVTLAKIAERIELTMPYRHRERNDSRVAHDFLARMIAHGEKCFQKRKTAVTGAQTADAYRPYTEAIEALREADKLLLAWANRSSHSFDVVQKEAEKLIGACEAALAVFQGACNKPVYKLEDKSAELVRCDCGDVRWRYGKA